MEKFLKKMEQEIDNKILACIRGQTIVKPFDTVFEEVRERVKKPKESSIKGFNKNTLIYSQGEESIYQKVIAQFLKEKEEQEEKE